MTNSSPPMLSPEEQEQLLQTIEMFEVIVEANPHDCQSLEILKDAYTRLGMKRELLKVSRRMAQTFMELGQFATAILEYEQILRHEPDNPEIIAALGDCEERMHRATQAPAPRAMPTQGISGSTEGAGLITTSATHGHATSRGSASSGDAFQDGQWIAPATDGNESLAKFLIQHKIVPEDLVQASLERVQKVNSTLKPTTLGRSLLDEIADRGGPEIETMLASIIDRTKFAYVPLEYYDVDRHVIRMLPEELTLKRLMVPFDVMSRTVMIAMANPFDAAGKEAAQNVLDYNIQWHVTSPEAILRILQQAYKTGNAPFQAAASEPPKPTEAPVFGEIPVSIPIPELKVAKSDAPLSGSSDSKSSSPLPDTTDFRLKK